MEAPVINDLTVFVSVLASMVIGFIWYLPQVFGKLWMSLVGKTKEQILEETKGRNMPVVYLSVFVAWLVTAYALAWMIGYFKVITWDNGLMLGLWVSLGFVLTTNLQHYLFENRPLKLYAVNCGYVTVCLVVMSVILATWR